MLKRIGLGRRPRGATTWRFDGRDARGKVLPDGLYEVAVAAHTAQGRLRSRWVRLRVDTEITAGLLRLDWPTVYPRTPDVVDTVSIDHLGDFLEGLDAGSFVILDSRGNQVAARAERPGTGNYCTLIDHATWCGMRHDWDGRLDGDARRSRSRTLPWSPDRAASRPPPMGSSHLRCRTRMQRVWRGGRLPVRSVTEPGRFGPGSLRYASKDTCQASSSFGKHQTARYHASLRGAAAAYGPWTVTASGGASTPGEPDVGWRFETRGTDSVDVAWFRLDYTHDAVP